MSLRLTVDNFEDKFSNNREGNSLNDDNSDDDDDEETRSEVVGWNILVAVTVLFGMRQCKKRILLIDRQFYRKLAKESF